jgi:hypothetical protein
MDTKYITRREVRNPYKSESEILKVIYSMLLCLGRSKLIWEDNMKYGHSVIQDMKYLTELSWFYMSMGFCEYCPEYHVPHKSVNIVTASVPVSKYEYPAMVTGLALSRRYVSWSVSWLHSQTHLVLIWSSSMVVDYGETYKNRNI